MGYGEADNMHALRVVNGGVSGVRVIVLHDGMRVGMPWSGLDWGLDLNHTKPHPRSSSGSGPVCKNWVGPGSGFTRCWNVVNLVQTELHPEPQIASVRALDNVVWQLY